MEISQQSVQKRLAEFKELMEESTEHNSPYKNDELCVGDVLDRKKIIEEFIKICTRIAFIGIDSTVSIDARANLKLMAIQRAYDVQIPMLKRAQ